MAYSVQALENFSQELTFSELCTEFCNRLQQVAFHGEGADRFCSAVELRRAFAGSSAMGLLDAFTNRARAALSLDAERAPTHLESLFSAFESDLTASTDAFSLQDALTPEAQNLAGDIAGTVEEFFAADRDHSADALCAFLEERLGITVEKTPDSGYFFRVSRINVDGAIPGSSGNFTFAIIPPGHTAPAHTHRAPNGTQFAGEYTVTVHGSLSYHGYTERGCVDEARVETHTADMGVRVSPVHSFDSYMPQQE